MFILCVCVFVGMCWFTVNTVQQNILSNKSSREQFSLFACLFSISLVTVIAKLCGTAAGNIWFSVAIYLFMETTPANLGPTILLLPAAKEQKVFCFVVLGPIIIRYMVKNQ